jgi:hypothetical protein
MWSDPRTKTIWNRLGLTSTNGAVIMSMEVFEKALDLARKQSLTSRADKEGGE